MTWDRVRAWTPADGPVWVHLDRSVAEAERWVLEDAGLEPATAAGLLAEETRPRAFAARGKLLLILRGVNLNPGAAPDDMIALRVWSDGLRVISLRHRRLLSTTDAAEAIEVGHGPRTAAALLVDLVTRLTGRVEPVLENLDEQTDGLEEGIASREPGAVRTKLAELRRQVVALRRYLAPQRLALASLAHDELSWLEPADRSHLREQADRTTRYVEDLEALRERGAVIHDELANHVAEQLNARMAILSLVAGVFLPLGLITGLLGINVGGMPGATDPDAFWVVCGILLGFGMALAAVLRWRRWL